jgi:tetratricopeptide (TPR) repeat protein
MKKKVLIDGLWWVVEDNEFERREDIEFNNMFILEGLGEKERLVSLLSELNRRLEGILVCSGVDCGGYVCIESSKNFEKVYWKSKSLEDDYNVEDNINSFGVKNLEKTVGGGFCEEEQYDIISSEGEIVSIRNKKEGEKKEEREYEKLSFGKHYEVFVRKDKYDEEMQRLLCVEEKEEEVDAVEVDTAAKKGKRKVITYNNLLCLAMIVKNGGESFRDILRYNKKYIDSYCILDTGSTDGTVEVAREELKDKRGVVYEEPFINFRDSRNRCLDLCGKSSKFIIMLDDTYMIENDLREFLERVRGDQVGDSFSMFIKSNDSEYGSNRIIKSVGGLRYIYKIHEVINPVNNTNIIVPMKYGYIYDYRSDYMEKRTMDRKAYDIKILKEMLQDDPGDSRAYYYLGQTYNLLGEHEKAFENFLKRVRHENEGFIQEKIDACFEAGRLSNFYLKNRTWEETEKLYLEAYRMDVSRPDSLYFIGIHYFLEREFEKAYIYFKEAYKVGFPEHCQYSLKPTLSYFYLPKFLCQVCYTMKDIALGKEVSEYFLENNRNRLPGVGEKEWEMETYTMTRWKRLYEEMLKGVGVVVMKKKRREDERRKRTIVFVVDGGFESWSGESIEKNGVGGSETHIIEMSRCFVLRGFHVVVFCRCDEEILYDNGVEYRKIEGYIEYLESEMEVETVIVSRYPEYLGRLYAMKSVKEVVLILHDMIQNGEIILRDEKLRRVILLSDFHKEVFDKMYPTMSDLTVVVGYGINVRDNEYLVVDRSKIQKNKQKVFMYSSMANRGLYNLLMMWRDIRKKYEDSVLIIHSDLESAWLNRVEKDMMVEIKRLVYELREEGIEYRGWTNKKELYKSWNRATIWFHPTTFLETYCLTALEAAYFGCLCVTSKIGSLLTTVGEERGYLLDFDGSDEGREKVLMELFEILSREEEVIEKVNRNYKWSREQKWERRCDEMLMYL